MPPHDAPVRPWRFHYARPGEITDGDTVMMQCDLGFSVHIEVPIRLTGVDAPELNTPEGEPARLRVSLWFAQHRHAADTAWPYRVDTVRMKRREREKMTFARYLGSVTCSEGHSLSEALGQQGDV